MKLDSSGSKPTVKPVVVRAYSTGPLVIDLAADAKPLLYQIRILKDSENNQAKEWLRLTNKIKFSESKYFPCLDV